MRSLVFASLALAAPPFAQTVIRPGDAALDTSHTQAGETVYNVRLLEPIQQASIGTLTERTTIADGRITRVSTISVPMARQAQTDSTVATWPGLAPISHHSTNARRTRALTFSAAGVAGTETAPDGTTTPADLAFDAPLFDASWTARIIQGLPLASGYTATIPAYEDGEGAVDITIEVTGRQDVETAAGTVSAFIVDTTIGEMTATYAIAETTREMLWTRLTPQPGAVIQIERP